MIIRQLNKKRKTAQNTIKDKNILHFFYKLYNFNASSNSRKNLTELYNIELKMDRYYINKYNDFYDILFIDNNGYIFHSIKKESDYHKNIFSYKFRSTKLAKAIKEKSYDLFIDYELYKPSDEPASFYISPVFNNNKLSGWIVLQYAINKINKLLILKNSFARTGEVYLVNEKKLMMSDSRFIEDSTILKQKIDTIAVRNAIKHNEGNRIIKDYRNINVYSSYEKFNYFRNNWIIIAEMDEDEVITKKYFSNKYYYKNIILNYFNTTHKLSKKQAFFYQKSIRVDMNEYAISKDKTALKTIGVGPCTACIIYYPNKFAYLVHISPTDRIYINNPVSKIFLGEKYTDFFANVFDKISHYELLPSHLNKLKFIIVNKHEKSLFNILDLLYDKGINISQVKALFNPDADYANVIFNPVSGIAEVEWVTKKFQKSNFQYSNEIESIGTIIKEI